MAWRLIDTILSMVRFRVSSPIAALQAEKAYAELNMPDGSIKLLKIADIYMRMSNAYAIRTMYGKTGENFLAGMYSDLHKSFRERGLLLKQKEDRTHAKGN